MKLTFESNLGYQQDAIRAIVDLLKDKRSVIQIISII